MRLPPLRFALALIIFGAMLAACSSGPGTRPAGNTPAPVSKPAASTACASCGVVERIESLSTPARSKPVATPMQGGVLGTVLSKPAPASAQPSAPTRSFRISLKLDDGRRVAIYQTSISPNLKVGSHVRVEKGRVILLR